MEHVFQWVAANPILAGAIGSILALILGAIAKPEIMQKAGFTVSQFIRKLGGAKLEEKVDDIVDNFDKGMKSDNHNQKKE
jgi:hypothetical protein